MVKDQPPPGHTAQQCRSLHQLNGACQRQPAPTEMPARVLSSGASSSHWSSFSLAAQCCCCGAASTAHRHRQAGRLCATAAGGRPGPGAHLESRLWLAWQQQSTRQVLGPARQAASKPNATAWTLRRPSWLSREQPRTFGIRESFTACCTRGHEAYMPCACVGGRLLAGWDRDPDACQQRCAFVCLCMFSSLEPQFPAPEHEA